MLVAQTQSLSFTNKPCIRDSPSTLQVAICDGHMRLLHFSSVSDYKAAMLVSLIRPLELVNSQVEQCRSM